MVVALVVRFCKILVTIHAMGLSPKHDQCMVHLEVSDFVWHKMASFLRCSKQHNNGSALGIVPQMDNSKYLPNPGRCGSVA
jgi:hypothetical protein